MSNIDKVLDAFLTGDYFIIFLILTLAILVVLVLALIKSRGEYNELLEYELNREKKDPNDIEKKELNIKEDNILDELQKLLADNKDDIIDENKPLIKQISGEPINQQEKIEKYELEDEENAVISAEELEKKTKDRLDELGSSENQIAIAKYEEEQESKAIISYEQLLKNTQNIKLSYTEEEKKDEDAPRINKIEVGDREVIGPEVYNEEDEFLKVLKEFRISLNENIFN
ncbi:MAG: hypothetical protein IKR57_01120 [Bacilli bacterium]|nr:hypothetical protein [Bacilli bacterium]